jgi:hypothetical protein
MLGGSWAEHEQLRLEMNAEGDEGDEDEESDGDERLGKGRQMFDRTGIHAYMRLGVQYHAAKAVRDRGERWQDETGGRERTRGNAGVRG